MLIDMLTTPEDLEQSVFDVQSYFNSSASKLNLNLTQISNTSVLFASNTFKLYSIRHYLLATRSKLTTTGSSLFRTK